MKPRYYKYKNDLENQKIGFIAQEMEEALPGSMIDSYLTKDGDPVKTYQLEWYPLLVKAIQEMNTKIIQLEKIVATK